MSQLDAPEGPPAEAGTPTPILIADARFRYHDGTRERYGDPLKIQLRLARACPGNDIRALDAPLRALDAAGRAEGDDATEETGLLAFGEAAERLDPIIAAGFDLPPFDEATGGGLVLLERIALLTGFLHAITPPGDAGDVPPEPEPEPEPKPAADAA